MIKLLYGDLQRLLKPLCYQMPMAVASTRLYISGALMTKQNRRSTESEQAIPDLGRVESIQNVGVSAQILLRGNGLEPRSRFKLA
jgi:hypothetical protein